MQIFQVVKSQDKINIGKSGLSFFQVMEAHYQWTTVSMLAISGYKTHHVDPVRLEVTAWMGKEYELFNDYEGKNMFCPPSQRVDV